MKVVINRCYGGFGLSENARKRYEELSGTHLEDYDTPGRSDSNLVQVVEELGSAANGNYAKLKIVEIPNDVEFSIEDYDGMEWVAEKHRTWS